MERSWHQGAKDLLPGAAALGPNFAEQWRQALATSPRFLFVTGWNEWIAGSFEDWNGYTSKDCYLPGGLFVDQYEQQYGRDGELMAGGHTDNHYYQLADGIRRYKGVRPPPVGKGPVRI